MNSIYREADELLQKGESFVMVTIFDKTGSAPRAAGAKMIVRSDGTIIGTIGGGRLEADAISQAKESWLAKQTMLHPFDLSSNDVALSDMICGGTGELLLDFVDAGDRDNLVVYEAAAQILGQRGKAWFITVLESIPEASGIKRQQCLVKTDGTLIGKIDCDPYILEKLTSGPAKISIHSEAIDNQRFLVEPLRQAGTVYIFGAGHVSQRIASLSVTVGFRTVVLDDRGDYANRDRFSEPAEIMVIDSFRQLPALEIDRNSYLVIVTRGHLYDRIVLEQVLRSGAGYIGMIGSRRKTKQIFGDMMNKGYRQEELDLVYTPIGIDIGAETPEELAVSIVGELIKVRADKERTGKKPKSASDGDCCRVLLPAAE